MPEGKGSISNQSIARRPVSDSLTEALVGRRSVRAFVPGSVVPRSVIEASIVAAGWAPSPHGRQPWRFTVIEDFQRRAALANAMADDWQRQLILDGQGAEIVNIRLEKGKARLTDASHLVLVNLYLKDLDDYPDEDRQNAETTMAIQSLGAAVQNLLLSIHASGYDAGWMCSPLFCPELVRKELNLSEALQPHALIPIGVAAKDPVRRTRRSLQELVVRWD
ncbi:nitroreductase family protein [soil metagenome]